MPGSAWARSEACLCDCTYRRLLAVAARGASCNACAHLQPCMSSRNRCSSVIPCTTGSIASSNMSGRRDTMLESEVVVCFCPRLVALPASILAAVMAVSSAADVINAISSIRSVERVAVGTEHTASAVGERRQPPPSFSGSGSSSVAIVFDVSTDGHAHSCGCTRVRDTTCARRVDQTAVPRLVMELCTLNTCTCKVLISIGIIGSILISIGQNSLLRYEY